MFKVRTALPVGANSVCDSNEVEKFALSSHKSTWAPLVFFLGPCFSLKKVQFGRPVEHINYRDTARLYESIPTETAVLVWSNAAHEGTIKSLKQTIVHGASMLDRLQSEVCSEMKVCALYFNQRITKKEVQEEMRLLIADDFVYESFQMALRRMRNEKIAFKLTNTLQLFIPEIQSEARTESITKLKWAVKYNPEVISFDEGNLLVDTFDIQDALVFAHKYGRKIRIARWGEEIPEVPLCELLYRSLLDFLQTGRYVDCEYVARARTFAENKSLNGLSQPATAEDIAFDYGYVLDTDGFITKLHKPLTPSVLGKKFFVADLFRPKKVVSPTAVRAEKDIKSPRRVSSFLSAITSKTSAESAPDDYYTIERQIQRELGLTETVLTPAATTAAGSVVSAETGTIIGKGSEGEGSLALIVAEAARNAQQVRRETNWVAFLNHKVPSSVTATYIRSKKGVSLPQQSQTPATPAAPTRIEGSVEPDVLAGLGSYTYGLGAKKPYKPAQSGAADATAATGQKDVWVERTEVSVPSPVSTKAKEETTATTRASPKEVKVSVSPEPAPHKDVPHYRTSHHPQPIPSQPIPPTSVQQTQPSTMTSVHAEKSNKSKKPLTIVVPELPTEKDEGEIQEIRKEGVNKKQSEQRADEKADEKSTLTPKIDAPLSFTTTNSTTTNTTQSIDTKDSKDTADSPIICAPVSVPVVPVTITASASSFPTTDSIVSPASTAAVAQQQTPLASQATRPMPSMPPLSPSSRFSPRARLIPTLSDESLVLENTSTSTSAGITTVFDTGNLNGEDSAVGTVDQAAEQAVAAALEKASAFRSRDVTPVAVTVAKGAVPAGVASIKVLHRPVPRAPSAMNMQITSRPLPIPPPLPARQPPAPMVVPITVREKKDVIERRIRSQRAPPAVCKGTSPILKDSTHLERSLHQQQNTGDKMASQDTKSNLVDQDGKAIKPSACTVETNAKAIAAPLVELNDNAYRKTDEEEANQPEQNVPIKPLTQKSLQKKWAFSTITQHQSGVK